MKLSLASDDADPAVVHVSGPMDTKHIRPELDTLAQLLGADAYQKRVVLNLNLVDSLDSSGVGWLLRAHKQFKERGGVMVLSQPSPFAHRVLKVLRLHEFFLLAANDEVARGLLADNGGA